MDTAESARRYRTTAVNTATPGQLVLMLFDGALRFMATAAAGFEEPALPRRFEIVHNNLVKAQNILRELQTTLDLEAGGQFSERMFALYDFMVTQLAEANLRKDPRPIRTVTRLLAQIRAAWAEMLAQSSSEAA
jgi:flagellar protein FliS